MKQQPREPVVVKESIPVQLLVELTAEVTTSKALELGLVSDLEYQKLLLSISCITSKLYQNELFQIKLYQSQYQNLYKS